jgi:hypothetical protein
MSKCMTVKRTVRVGKKPGPKTVTVKQHRPSTPVAS